MCRYIEKFGTRTHGHQVGTVIITSVYRALEKWQGNGLKGEFNDVEIEQIGSNGRKEYRKKQVSWKLRDRRKRRGSMVA